VLQCIAVCCSVLQSVRHELGYDWLSYQRLPVNLLTVSITVQHTMHHTLQHIATLHQRCLRMCTPLPVSNTMQYTVYCITLQHNATHSILHENLCTLALFQHTATRCNTMQHAATNYNTQDHSEILPKNPPLPLSNTLQHAATQKRTAPHCKLAEESEHPFLCPTLSMPSTTTRGCRLAAPSRSLPGFSYL